MSIPLSETPTVGLGKFIKEARFNVPSHQRDYSWKIEYVEQFLDDIIRAMDSKDTIYFCGLMVFIKDEAPGFQVLDGQQRLATTIMIFSAIRNWFSKYSEFSQFQHQMDNKYLGETEIGETEMQPKISLNSANNEMFKRSVIDIVPISEIQRRLQDCKKGDRNRSLLEAAIYLNHRVGKIAESCNSPTQAKEYFINFIKFVEETVRVVRLIVRGEEAAYTIFETLNDRGMELSPMDLVKNHLFSKAEGYIFYSPRDMESRWTEMMNLLADKKADSFLRAFWASRHGAPEGARLFAPFKKTYDTPQKAIDVSIDLKLVAEHYVALGDPDDALWSKHTTQAKDSLRALTIVGSTQFYPLILSAISKPEAFTPREMERLLRLIEVLAVRYVLIGRGRPGRIESLGGKAAKMIYDGKIRTTTEVLAELNELYISDEQFKLSFQNADVSESKKTSYLLKKLERQARQQRQDIHFRETTPDAVTIEHILPKSPGSGWATVTSKLPNFHSEYLYRIGNMCLLSDANRSLGNKGFSDKKKVYATSQLELTRSVADYTDWNPEAVDNRQTYLANLALAEWRFQ